MCNIRSVITQTSAILEGGFLGLFTVHRLRLILMSQDCPITVIDACLATHISWYLESSIIYGCTIYIEYLIRHYVDYSNSACVIETFWLINAKKRDLINKFKKIKISLNIIIKH